MYNGHSPHRRDRPSHLGEHRVKTVIDDRGKNDDGQGVHIADKIYRKQDIFSRR
jgi:hypothetical protein